MDHTCHRCGATLEEGVPFCPQCGAPQIRVSAAGTHEVQPATPPIPPGTPDEIQPAAQPFALGKSENSINWSNGVPAAALTGLLMAVISVIPFLGIGCCLWIFGGGALAVRLYQHRQQSTIVTRGMGARLGLLSGVFGFFVYAILESLRILVFRLGGVISGAVRQGMERAAAQNPDPHAQQVVQWLTSPTGVAFMVTLFTAASFLAFLIFASAGGALGAVIWGQKRPAASGS